MAVAAGPPARARKSTTAGAVPARTPITATQAPGESLSVACTNVSELVVVFAVCIFSLLLAGFLASKLLKRSASNPELERLLGAVRRACADFLWKETKILAFLLVVAGLALACPLAIWGATTGTGAQSVAWSVAALCLGAAGGIGVAHTTHWAAARATSTALEALRQDLEGATSASYRGAALVGLIAEAASLLLTACLFAGHYLYLALMGRADLGETISGASRSLPAAALGAFCAAAVFQVGGCNYQTAAGVAGTGARARHAHIARDEEQNPALVAELVGDCVGGAVCRSTDVFCALLLGNCGLVVVAGLVARSNSMVGLSALALAGLPMIIRSVGLLSTGISMSSLRFEGPLSLVNVFAAARGSHALILLTGLSGASLWLLGDVLYLTYVGAGALGILASVLSAALLVLRSRRLGSGLNEASGLPPREASVARALGLGLQYAGSPLLVVGACLGGAWLLGAQAPLDRGGAFALVVAIAAMLGTGAFNLSESLLSALGETVRRVAGLRRGELDPLARQRAAQLAREAQAIGDVGHSQCILAGATAAVLASVMLPSLGSEGAASGALPEVSVSFAHPVIILGGVLGAGSLLFHIGGVLRSSSRAATALEDDLQVRLEARSGGADGSGALPNYRDSVQLATTGATEALLPLVLTALLTPFVVGILLRLVYGPLGSAITTHGLMALGTIAALTGCCVALAAQGTLVALGTERGAPVGAKLGALGMQSASEFVGRCVGPAALLALKAGVVSSLAAVPLLFST